MVQKVREGGKSHCLCVCYCCACPPSIRFANNNRGPVGDPFFCLRIRYGEGHGGGGGVRTGTKKKRKVCESVFCSVERKRKFRKKGLFALLVGFRCWKGQGRKLSEINCVFLLDMRIPFGSEIKMRAMAKGGSSSSSSSNSMKNKMDRMDPIIKDFGRPDKKGGKGRFTEKNRA